MRRPGFWTDLVEASHSPRSRRAPGQLARPRALSSIDLDPWRVAAVLMQAPFPANIDCDGGLRWPKQRNVGCATNAGVNTVTPAPTTEGSETGIVQSARLRLTSRVRNACAMVAVPRAAARGSVESQEVVVSYVWFKCNRCGLEEHPMRHASNGCGGQFVWQNTKVKCLRCEHVYSTHQAFWCGRCRKHHSDFELE